MFARLVAACLREVEMFLEAKDKAVVCDIPGCDVVDKRNPRGGVSSGRTRSDPDALVSRGASKEQRTEGAVEGRGFKRAHGELECKSDGGTRHEAIRLRKRGARDGAF